MSLGTIGWGRGVGMGFVRMPGMWGLAELADLGDDTNISDWLGFDPGPIFTQPPTPVIPDVNTSVGIPFYGDPTYASITPSTAPAAIAKLPNGTFDITKLMPLLAQAIKSGTQLALPAGSYMQTDANGNTVLVKQPLGTPVNFAAGAGQLGGTLGLSSSLSGMLPILLIGAVAFVVLSKK